MRSPLSRAAAAACLTAAFAAPAAAQLQNVGQTCGGIAPGEYNLCYAISNLAFDVNTVSFRLANLTDPFYGATHLSEFIVSGLGSGYTVQSLTGLAGAPAIDGTTKNSLGFNGAGLVAGRSFVGFNFGGNAGILAGSYADLTFTFDQPVMASDFAGSNIQVAMMVQGAQVAGCASSKAVFDGSGVAANGTVLYGDGAMPCAAPPVLTTPEPATLFLVATGALSIGAVALRRRRERTTDA